VTLAVAEGNITSVPAAGRRAGRALV